MESDIVINRLLYFINSAQNDYDQATLINVMKSFYFHEEIKKAKELVCVQLKKGVVWRRDPDKKDKNLKVLVGDHKILSEAPTK